MTSKPPPSTTPEVDRDPTSSILSDLKGTGEAPAMPDLGGVNPAAKQSKYKVHSQTLVIALVLAASGAALYTMRKQGMGSGVNFNPPKIDYQVDHVKRSASDAQQAKLLDDLARSQNPGQIPAEKIQKNPFQLDSAAAVAHQTNTIDPEAAGRNALAMREQQIKTALASVEVNAIMAGPVPLARVNGRIVREGDTVAEVFTVKTILDRSVELEADAKTYAVNMSETAAAHKPRPLPPRR